MKTCPVCDSDYPDQHATCPTDGAVLIESKELRAGSLVRGKYRITSKLGQGGMGVVYLAEHILLGGPVALKFLAGDLGKDPKFIKRFRMEARAAHQLRHPNIVQVLDLDQSEDGSLFIAMEYINGPSLRAALDEARTGFEIPRALALTRGIAAGLAAAHAHGTVHRDIKPENIMLDHSVDGAEIPKVLDFGIVAMADNVTRQSLTHGLLLTPPYAAPEQWEEMPSTEIDGRTDFYALGCVFYEMLTGRTPFHAHNTSGWMKQHLEQTPQPPSQLRPEVADWPGLDGLAMRLLAKNRDDRPQDDELLSLLDEALPGGGHERPRTMIEEDWKRPEPVPEPIPAAFTPVPQPAPQPAAQAAWPRWAWGAVAALALAAVMAAGWFTFPSLHPNSPSNAPAQHDSQAESAASAPAAALAAQNAVAPAGSATQPSPSLPSATPTKPAANSTPSGAQPAAAVEAKPAAAEIAQTKQQAVVLYGQRRYAEAAPLLTTACTNNSWEACKDLGILYRDGNGVARDDARAVAFFSKACEADPPKGCNSLGAMYASGNGVTKDDARAASFYSAACDAEDAMGCSNLGNIYASGRGVAKDDTRAAAFYAKACNGGNAVACSNLGASYRYGRGVQKDLTKANQFLSKGCSLGNQWGCDRLKEMK